MGCGLNLLLCGLAAYINIIIIHIPVFIIQPDLSTDARFYTYSIIMSTLLIGAIAWPFIVLFLIVFNKQTPDIHEKLPCYLFCPLVACCIMDNIWERRRQKRLAAAREATLVNSSLSAEIATHTTIS